jgi:hypothetical protein
MKVFHDELPAEANEAADALRRAFGSEVTVEEKGLTQYFDRHRFDHRWINNDIHNFCQRDLTGGNALLLVDIELRYSEDEGVIGYWQEGVAVLSPQRLRGDDDFDRTRNARAVEYPTYARRIGLYSVHLLGHNLIQSQHMQETFWFDGVHMRKYSRGPHCPDPTCAMFELMHVEKRAPRDGYLLIGNTVHEYHGLDHHARRLRKDYFCDDCTEALEKASGLCDAKGNFKAGE